MVRAWQEPVEVGLDTKSFAELARRRAEHCIAEMRLVFLVALEGIWQEVDKYRKRNLPGNTTAFVTRERVPTR